MENKVGTGQPESSLKPIHWLASYPKSGNTWIRFLLSAYNFGKIDLNQGDGLIQGDSQVYPHHVVAPLALEKLTPPEILHLRNAALMHIITLNNKSINIVKTHNANIRINQINVIPPTMTTNSMYILRDPRDVIISYAKHMGRTIDSAIEMFHNEATCIDGGYIGIYQYLTSWSKHVVSWVDNTPTNLLVIRYEDLLTDAANWLREIVRHLGMEPSEERVEQALELADFNNLKQQEQEEGFHEASRHNQDGFFDRGYAGYYKDILSRNQRKRIERENGEVMERFGYL